MSIVLVNPGYSSVEKGYNILFTFRLDSFSGSQDGECN